MVKARTDAIQAVMTTRSLSKADVASKAGVDQRTVENALAGRQVSAKTIEGLLNTFAPATFEDLFEVVETDDED